MRYVNITQTDGEVSIVYDLDKVSFATKLDNDRSIRMVIDGVNQVFNYVSKEDRDKNFDWIVKHLNEKNGETEPNTAR